MSNRFEIPEGDRILLDHSGNADDVQRFEQAFLRVWGQLPADDRSAIVALWQEQGGLAIAVMGNWIGRGRRSAECIEPGDKLRFFDEHIAGMSDMMVDFAIAHELAHVYLIATDDSSHARYFSPAGTEEDHGQCEVAVRATMRRWGMYDDNASAQGADLTSSRRVDPDVK